MPEKSKQEKRGKEEAKIKEASVQAYLEIAEIRDNLIILKDNSLRAVLMVSSLNFDLKSEEEQEVIILSYQSFLNSLNFPAQILIRSKRLDLDNYLFQLEEKKKKELNEFIKAQIDEYINFIKSLLEISNIMDKKFYVVIPFYPSGLETGVEKVGALQKIANSLNPTWVQKKKEEDFELHKAELLERVNLVVNGLNSLGLRAAQLATLDIIELFYEIYNLDSAQREKLTDIDALTSSFVK